MRDILRIIVFILKNKDLILSILTIINRIKREQENEVQK